MSLATDITDITEALLIMHGSLARTFNWYCDKEPDWLKPLDSFKGGIAYLSLHLGIDLDEAKRVWLEQPGNDSAGRTLPVKILAMHVLVSEAGQYVWPPYDITINSCGRPFGLPICLARLDLMAEELAQFSSLPKPQRSNIGRRYKSESHAFDPASLDLVALAPRMARFILECDWDENSQGDRECWFDLEEFEALSKELEALQ